MAVIAATAALTIPPAQAAKHPDGMDVRAGSPHGFVPAKEAKASRPRGGSPNMTWHGGPIMTSSAVFPIYWGTSWANYSGDKISGLDTFYKGYSGSNYAKASDEYNAGGSTVGPNNTTATAKVDTTAAPGHAPSTSSILAEVARMYPTPVANGYYPVYTDTPRGGAQYCAWHSYGTVNGKAYIFAFFFSLDGDPGCDPGSTVANQSQGLAALANVSAHELSEARTDPDASAGWFDSSGAENADKCAWTFNVGAVNLGGTSWKLQGEWSNAAYNAGTGYPNNSGQRGCLSGA